MIEVQSRNIKSIAESKHTNASREIFRIPVSIFPTVKPRITNKTVLILTFKDNLIVWIEMEDIRGTNVSIDWVIWSFTLY